MPAFSPSPPTACAVCGKEDGLLRCCGCKVIHYCSVDHQIEHRPAHKEACKEIKFARETVEIEEDRFKKAEQYLGTALSLFTYPLGDSFLLARTSFFDALTAVSTKASLQAQLDNLLRLFLVGPHHAPFARFYCQSLMLRLGKDQECYDLTEWFRSVIDVPADDWASIAGEGVDIQGADPLDACTISYGGKVEHDLAIHQILIKVRCYVNLMAIEEVDNVYRTQLAPALLRRLKESLLANPILKYRPEILDNENPRERAAVLGRQFLPMMHAVYVQNKHYWPALTAPEALDHLGHVPQMQSWITNDPRPDSPEWAEELVKMTISAWCTTPGALEFIREKWHSWREIIVEAPREAPYDF